MAGRLVGLVVVILAACNDEKNETETVEPEEVDLYSATCYQGDCDLVVVAEADALASCYGWNPEDGWGIDTPEEVAAACPDPNPLDDCEVVVGVLDDVGAARDLDCVCRPDGTVFGPNCCDFLWEQMDLSAADALLAEINADCPVGHVDIGDCTGGLGEVETCDGPGFAISPNADLILHLDDLTSYIEVTMPGDTQTFSVAGGGSAGTNPDGFMTATIWAEDGEFGGDDWIDWKWWMTAPLSIDLMSGDFTIPVGATTPPFDGAGYMDETPKRATVFMDEEPTGHVYSVGQTFDLDFSQTSNGWTIEVHLEGEYEPAE